MISEGVSEEWKRGLATRICEIRRWELRIRAKNCNCWVMVFFWLYNTDGSWYRLEINWIIEIDEGYVM